MLKLGLESGDQGVLDRMGKGIDLGTAARVLSSLRQAGIAVYCYLLFGTPGETALEARRTLEFVVRHREAIGFLNLAVFTMPLGADEAGDYGTAPFSEGDLSLCHRLSPSPRAGTAGRCGSSWRANSSATRRWRRSSGTTRRSSPPTTRRF